MADRWIKFETHDCWACQKASGDVPNRMIACPMCGNKRCPKASDHTLACTGSNAPGQPGSIFTKDPSP